MLHTSGGIQVFRAADRSLSTYQYKSFLKIIKRNRGKGENFFSREKKFSPSPRTPLPLSKKTGYFGVRVAHPRGMPPASVCGGIFVFPLSGLIGVCFSTAYQ